MKKVVIVDYWAHYSPYLEVMAAIARREADAGADVKYYSCDGALLACEVDLWGNKIACINCRKRMAWASKTIDIKQTVVPIHHLRDYNVDLSQLKTLKNYNYRKVNIGVGCASSYISATRDQDITLNSVTSTYIVRQLISAKMIVDAFYGLIEREKPDTVFLMNGRGFINRAIVGVCEIHKVHYVTVELGATDERVEEYPATLPHSIEARTRMMKDLWQMADSEEKFKIARTFYERKRSGAVTNDKSYVAHQKKGLLQDLPLNKSIISIFNSSDDEIQSIGDEWAFSASINQFEVVAALLSKTANQNVFFIVRMHPNLATVRAPWVKKWEQVKGYPNCLFIDATSPISSYEVLDAADKVLVFGSTIGAEAVAAGKTVILYGNSFYERLNICHCTKSIENLTELCLQPLKPKDPEPALMYAYNLMFSGATLEGYMGNRQEQDFRLLGKRAPICRTNSWRSGIGWFLLALHWLGNRLIKRRILKSLT